MVGTDLVTEAAGTAVNHHTELSLLDAEGLCRLFVQDLLCGLQFQEMVSGAECSHLRNASLASLLTDRRDVCAGHCPVLLASADISLASVAEFHCMACAFLEHER